MDNLTTETGARLPTSTTISRYELELCPDLRTHKFSGSGRYKVSVTEATNRLVLHCIDLHILAASLDSVSADFALRPESERVEIVCSPPLVAGSSIILSLEWISSLNDRLIGFYRSSYSIPGETQQNWLATTQFEACDARRAFPCLDEPALRAEMLVSLVVPEGCIGLSNMPASSQRKNASGGSVVTFMPTPPMSTYIVAFAVGNFEKITSVGPRGLPVSVYATPGKQAQCAFALDVAVRSLVWLEDFFGIEYPLPKLDLLAVPDFSIGTSDFILASLSSCSPDAFSIAFSCADDLPRSLPPPTFALSPQ